MDICITNFTPFILQHLYFVFKLAMLCSLCSIQSTNKRAMNWNHFYCYATHRMHIAVLYTTTASHLPKEYNERAWWENESRSILVPTSKL